MTSKEYYAKYMSAVIDACRYNDKPEALNEIGQNLAEDLDREAIRIAKEMNHGMSTNFIKILANQNMKWNSICKYFKKKHGFEPFDEDWFASEYCVKKYKNLNAK